MASEYLDKSGVAYFWGKIVDKIDDAPGTVPFAKVDSTSTATAFTATVPGITELRDGVMVFLKNGVVTSAAGFTININNLGAKPVYTNMAAATAETTIFNVAYTMLFIYDSTRVSGGAWICYRGYDSVSGVEVATMEEVQSYLGMDSVTPSVTMISFTVSGRSGYATYQGQAEDGMTWADWVESEYNTGNFSNEYFYIRRTSDSAYYVPSVYVTINSNAVLPSDTIVDEEEYGLATGVPEYYGGGND